MRDMIDRAVEFAVRRHAGQVRKGTDVPYVTHPLAVGLMLAMEGCREALIVAGLLHDTVEDTSATLEELRDEFGDEVADLVEGCSEPDKSLSWEDRKRHTHLYLKTAPLDVRIVSCADKLHNVKTMTANYEELGEDLWQRFNRGRDKQKWYFEGLVEGLCGRDDIPEDMHLFDDFEASVKRLFGIR
jgi:(p)ppGpp synthase/HD superfamily hydrolase